MDKEKLTNHSGIIGKGIKLRKTTQIKKESPPGALFVVRPNYCPLHLP